MSVPRTARRLILLSIVGAGLHAQGGPSPAGACIEAFTGRWRGPGRVAGRDIAMRQDWQRAVGGAFAELVMTHHQPADTGRAVFEGRGFYRASATTDSVTGAWLDARGFIMNLMGTCANQTAQMRWTGVSERGETSYTLQPDGTLLVLDRVEVNGALRDFGRSTLRRQAPEPEMLAPGVISTAAPEFATTVTPDGRELYFNRTNADRSQMSIMVSERSGTRWSIPRLAPFSGQYRDIDPFVSPDGRRLYFNSDRPRTGASVTSYSTWYVDRTPTGWGPPIDPGAPFNSDSSDVFVSANRQGDVIFSSTRDGERRFYVTREAAGRWTVPVALAMSGPPGPGNPMLSPSGRYLVFTRNLPGRGADLFVACKTMTGFGEPTLLPSPVNSPFADFAPGFDSEEQTLFFTSERAGQVGSQPDGARPPGDLYQVPWAAVAPPC